MTKIEKVENDGEECILVTTEDAGELATALERRADDPRLHHQMGQHTRERFLSDYAPDVATAALSRKISGLIES